MQTQVKMKLERETKGAVRYFECDQNENPIEIPDGAKLGTLYVRKTTFSGGEYPQKITVTIQEGDF